MKRVVATFMRGVGVVLPLALTVGLFLWLARGAEALMRDGFVAIFPNSPYFPGLGILAGVALIYAIGVLIQNLTISRVWQWVERMLKRIPLVNTIYNAINDFVDFFSSGFADQATKVVAVEIDGVRLIGFVTDESPSRFGVRGKELVTVYLPLSYQIGGFTVLLPKDRIEYLDVPAEEALRFVLTAGITRQKP